MLRLFWLGPLVLLQACAGTPVAERLERSFSANQSEMSSSGSSGSPPAATSASAAAPDRSVDLVTPAEKAATKTATIKKDTPEKDSESKTPAIREPSSPPGSEISVVEAEPYRITIRLSGADPSAPAEAVTRALRNADVRFAVERIERIQP